MTDLPTAAESDVVLPSPSLVVMAGPPGSGKSSWAATNLPDSIVSSDDLRALVGAGPHDLGASKIAFELLDRAVEARLGRGFSVVVDTLGTDPAARGRWRSLAAAAGVPAFVVLCDTEPATVRELNRARTDRVPEDVLRNALARWPKAQSELLTEPWAGVIRHSVDRPARVRTATADIAAAKATVSSHGAADTPGRDRTGLRVGLHIGRFDWATKPTGGAPLQELADATEAAGFHSMWVMDHLRQIPQVGRAWDPMLEAWTTLGFLAAHTDAVRLGTLVSCVSHRNIGLLAKCAATTDVLSGGRVTCGIGAGWFAQEQRALGYPDLSTTARLDLLEDAAQALPLLWGKGSPSFEGHRTVVPEAMSYPRPIQDPLPLLVGGGGERRTLAIAAAHAQMCNVIGDLATVEHKLRVLDEHCARIDRSPGDIERTVLLNALVGDDTDDLTARVADLAPRRGSRERYAASVGAGTVADQVARLAALARVGVDEVIVSFPDTDPDAIRRFAPVIDAVSSG